MKTRNQDFVLGLTVLGFLALFLATMFWLYPTVRYATHRIVVHFRHEDGIAPIKPGSPVLLGGSLQIGQVVGVAPREVTLETAQGKTKQVVIVVEADIDATVKLYLDCQITTDQPAVGGGGFLVILNVGTPGTPAVTAGVWLHGLPPQSLAATISMLSRRLLAPDGMVDRLDRALNPEVEGSPMNKLSVSLSDVNDMTRALREQLDARQQATLMSKTLLLLDDLRVVTMALREQMAAGEPGNLLAKLHSALDRLTEGLAEAKGLLQENRPVVQSALGNLERTTRTINDDLLAVLRGELRRDDPATLLSKIHAGLDQLNVSLNNVTVMSDAGRQMILLNRPTIDQIIANFRDTSRQLEATSSKVYLAPWLLFYRPTPGETQEVQVLEAARTFAEAATNLNDAATRLEAVAAAAPPGAQVAEADKEVKAIRDALRAAFDRFRQAETFFYEKMK